LSAESSDDKESSRLMGMEFCLEGTKKKKPEYMIDKYCNTEKKTRHWWKTFSKKDIGGNIHESRSRKDKW
jgi:hypothetical protein